MPHKHTDDTDSDEDETRQMSRSERIRGTISRIQLNIRRIFRG